MTRTEAIHLWFAFEKELEDPAPLLTDKLLRDAIGRLYPSCPPLLLQNLDRRNQGNTSPLTPPAAANRS